jgi:hypothetical protein
VPWKASAAAVFVALACQSGTTTEPLSSTDFALVNATGTELLAGLNGRSTLIELCADSSIVVRTVHLGFTCNQANTISVGCLGVFRKSDRALVYQVGPGITPPWTSQRVGECRYRYELVLEPQDLGTVADSLLCIAPVDSLIVENACPP